MLIIHNDGMGITNMDTVCELVVSGRYIHAYCVNGSHHPVAVYGSIERAMEVFKDIIGRVESYDDYTKTITLPEE